MAKPKTMATRKLVSFPAPLAQAIEDFRYTNRIPSDSEAIRQLVEVGLGKAKRAAPASTPGSARKPRSTGKSPASRKAPERKAASSSKLDQIRALREQGAG